MEQEEKKPVGSADEVAGQAQGQPAVPRDGEAGNADGNTVSGHPVKDGASSGKDDKQFRLKVSIDGTYDKEAENQADGPVTELKAPQEGQGQKGKGGRKEKTKRRGCVNAVIYTLVVLALSLVLAYFALSAAADMMGVGKPEGKVDVVIPSGANAAQIAAVLKNDGVINNVYAFRLYVKLIKFNDFKVGTFTLDSSMGYDEIIKILSDSSNNKKAVKVLIPEGKTMQQIGDILEQNGVCSQQDFLTAVETGGFNYSFEAQIPDNENRFYKYEGYLFPDTYEMLKDSSGRTAAKKMLDNFNKKFDSGLIARARELNMTIDQVVTLASVIQAESGDVKQMGKVSSVFHNRLKNGVKESGGKKLLQSDVTVFYGKRDIANGAKQLSRDDIAIASAYNTYLNEGLPPGPVCNPGLDAIRAALNPEKTDFYYFVTDANGNYYYAVTYAEHMINVKKALRNGTAKGTDVYK